MAQLDALLDGLDENLQPLDAENIGEKEEVKEEKVETEAEETKEDTEESEDTEEATKKEAEDGLTLDELEADDEKEEEATEKAEPNTTGLTDEQLFIYKGLPTMTVADKEGKVYSVKTYAELPVDFEFANKRDELAFSNALNAQEFNARELQGKYRTSQSEKSAAEWRKTENLADRYDIDELQDSGEIAKFAKDIKPGTKEFSAQPVAKLIKEIMAYKDELNQANYERSQKNGTAMRLVGFKEAFIQYKYYDKGGKVENPKQKAEDIERKKLAKRTVGAKGTDTSEQKPRPFLRSQRDLMGYIDSLDI